MNNINFSDIVPDRSNGLYQDLSNQISKLLKNENVLFQITDGGAIGEFNELEPYLKKYGITYDSYNTGEMSSFAEYNNNEIRTPVIGINKFLRHLKKDVYDMEVDWNDVDSIVVFDDAINSARTIMGSLKRGLEIADYFDIDNVYVSSVIDRKNISHAAGKWYGDRVDIKNFLKKNMPNTYDDLNDNNLLSRISDKVISDYERLGIDHMYLNSVLGSYVGGMKSDRKARV